MNELIKVDYTTERPTVSARELHGFLKVGSEFSHWFKRMCEYGFTEGQDFSPFLTESTGGRPAQDAQLTIDMAKEICMLQRNEKGKEARQYFIQLEKDWNSPEKVMARALQIADRKIHRLEAEAEANRPKVLFADAVATSKSSILVGELAKLLKQNGVKDMGQNRLFDWMRNSGYLIRRKGTDYNMPTQRSMELGLMEIKETSISHADGHVSVSKTPKITGKGQQYFISKLLGKSKITRKEESEMRIDRVKLIAEMARQEIKNYELAEKAGISIPTIVGIRSGRACTANTAKHIAHALGVAVESLLEDRKEN